LNHSTLGLRVMKKKKDLKALLGLANRVELLADMVQFRAPR